MQCYFNCTLIFFAFFLCVPITRGSIEYIIAGGLGVLGVQLYKNYEKFVGCTFSECCSTKLNRADWIAFDSNKLAQSLDNYVHGQHLVKNIIVKALKSHFAEDEPPKALVLSFHGWTGSGKNLVSRLVAESIFKRGMKSKYVHLFVSMVNFPYEDKVDIYKLQLQDWIRGNVSECATSLFIFDEIDKMPVKMIDAIKPFIDYHDTVTGVNFRKSVFIFLSNTGSRDIINKAQLNWREGKERHDIKYADMEELILKGAFNEKGGLHQSDLIQHRLIDFYVPFLPLQRQHVRLCIRDELKRINVKQTDEFIEMVLDDMLFFPPGSGLFSSRGCKSVSSKVGYLLVNDRFDEIFN